MLWHTQKMTSYRFSNLFRFCVWLFLLQLVQSARNFVKDLAQEADDVWDFMPAQKKGLQRIKWSSRQCNRRQINKKRNSPAKSGGLAVPSSRVIAL